MKVAEFIPKKFGNAPGRPALRVGTPALRRPPRLPTNAASTGTNTFEWDAMNRLTAINEGGTNRSEFAYDGAGHRVQIVERNPTSNIILSAKTFLWCGTELCEERDASGTNVIKRFFAQGEQIGGTNYFYTKDHLGSIREMTDASGIIHTRYDYDPYGRLTKVSGDMDADFAFTGHYEHCSSGLYLTLYRAYDPDAGRWLSRDPKFEITGINLYKYADNNPLNYIDPLGLSFLGWAGNLLTGAVYGAAGGGLSGLVTGAVVGFVVGGPAGALAGASAGLVTGLAAGAVGGAVSAAFNNGNYNFQQSATSGAIAGGFSGIGAGTGGALAELGVGGLAASTAGVTANVVGGAGSAYYASGDPTTAVWGGITGGLLGTQVSGFTEAELEWQAALLGLDSELIGYLIGGLGQANKGICP